jgi:hypothetical protein
LAASQAMQATLFEQKNIRKKFLRQIHRQTLFNPITKRLMNVEILNLWTNQK